MLSAFEQFVVWYYSQVLGYVPTALVVGSLSREFPLVAHKVYRAFNQHALTESYNIPSTTVTLKTFSVCEPHQSISIGGQGPGLTHRLPETVVGSELCVTGRSAGLGGTLRKREAVFRMEIKVRHV